MAQESLVKRMDMLERRVEILEQLPARLAAVESQIVQLRDEMRSEFSATRAATREGDEQVARGLRDEIRESNENTVRTLRDEIRESNENTVRMLHDEIRAGDEETRRVLTERMESLFNGNERHMRLLHEDLVGRIADMNEGR
jgi:hypothetical protein